MGRSGVNECQSCQKPHGCSLWKGIRANWVFSLFVVHTGGWYEDQIWHDVWFDDCFH